MKQSHFAFVFCISLSISTFSDFILAKNMGRPRTKKPRKYSKLDIYDKLSNLRTPMKPMKLEDSKIKLVSYAFKSLSVIIHRSNAQMLINCFVNLPEMLPEEPELNNNNM